MAVRTVLDAAIGKNQGKNNGFRTPVIVAVTTRLDPVAFPTSSLTDLYRRRWEAELQLRSLKVVLQMDHLRCQKPHRVRNERWMHLLAYNLIRDVMAQSADRAATEPRSISFKGALQTVNAFLPTLAHATDLPAWCDALLSAIASHRVGHRPDRVEPRAVERRPKQYARLTKPRADYKTLAVQKT